MEQLLCGRCPCPWKGFEVPSNQTVPGSHWIMTPVWVDLVQAQQHLYHLCLYFHFPAVFGVNSLSSEQFLLLCVTV